MKVNNKQKVFTVGAVFLVVIAVITGMNWMKYSARKDLADQMDKLKTQEVAAQGRIKEIPRLLEERSQLIANVDKYTTILPADEHVQHDAFVETIDTYRQDTDLKIQKADYIKTREQGGKNRAQSKRDESFVRHRYRFSLLGSVPDFKDFLNKIENHPRFLKIDSMKIAPFEDRVASTPGRPMTKEETELASASNETKEIELTISTYTYKGTSKEAEKL